MGTITTEQREQSTLERSQDFGATRYKYDCEICPFSEGWAQVDTRQDASYFGTWTNPTTRQIVCYCEGDVTRETFSNDHAYVIGVRALHAWSAQAGYWKGIDATSWSKDETLIRKFIALGLGDLLH